MTSRIEQLRSESTEAVPTFCPERALLLTGFYRDLQANGKDGESSVPVVRARALRYLMEHKSIPIGEGELIVGERGSLPKAAPTFPELCCHGLEDMRVINTRNRTRFRVTAETRDLYEREIIPFWSGKTIRERLFESMSEDWRLAFESGVFTEFMEQRAPGHAILDGKIYHSGLLDFKKRITVSKENLSNEDPEYSAKFEELTAMGIACDAVIALAGRYAAEADKLARTESDAGRRRELRKITKICRRVPAHAPRSFHEALQSYWFVHLGVITELNTWDSYNPGRLDQHLKPFYDAEIEAGTLTRAQAMELLECFWIKFNNQPAPPKVGITEEQSGTYQDFALINVGGVLPDGSDAVNELSYLILDVVEELQLIQPSVCIQFSEKNPDEFLRRASEVVRTGLGQPSMFNTDIIMKEMEHAGKSVEDARAGGPSGCVTISAFGKESCTLTGYLNWPKILELALNNGVDPNSGRQVGPQTGDPLEFTCFDDLFTAYAEQMRHFVDTKIEGNNVIERLYASAMPCPFMSVIVDDCIDTGRDYHDGGARYNSTYIQGVGLGTATDALSAMKYHVFDHNKISMQEMIENLQSDFEGNEPLRQKLARQTPAYGNDDQYADTIAERLFELYFDCIDGRPNTKGGQYRVNLLPTTVHVYFGKVTGALPNGRKAHAPLSEGISPTQGADLRGPTAVCSSAAKIDHSRTGGTLLNLKFDPAILEGVGLERLCELVKGYFTMGGHHCQFNVVSAETMRKAQAEPDKYRDLIVRVAGYSDYFVDIGPELQREIMSRTAQEKI